MPIFSGIRIIDMGRILAAPWATQILGDLGAEIIKIEHPTHGDDTRQWGPPFVSENHQDMSAYFTATNRNKKSLAIDIKTQQGQKIIKQLAKKSDALIENFKTNGLKKYNLDYQSIKKINNKIIYCSITGFGQSGPDAHRPGYDLMMQAISGLMSITGEPNQPPVKVGVAACDIFTGLYSTIAIISALWHRENTQQGQYIDMSLFNVSLNILANQAANFLIADTIPQPLGSAHPNIVPYQAFQCSDGYILIAVGNDSQFKNLCSILKCNTISTDSKYKTNAQRVKNRQSLIPILQDKLTQQSCQNWSEKLKNSNIPFSPINSIKQAFNEPQAIAQNIIQNLNHHQYGNIKSVSNPINFSQKNSKVTNNLPPPKLGEHNNHILSDILNLSQNEIKTLQHNKIIS